MSLLSEKKDITLHVATIFDGRRAPADLTSRLELSLRQTGFKLMHLTTLKIGYARIYSALLQVERCLLEVKLSWGAQHASVS